MRIGALVVGTGVLGAMVLASAHAWAVAAPPCVAAKMYPSAAVIPANLPGFGYTALAAQASDVHLFKTTGGAPTTEVPVTLAVTDGLVKITPTTPLIAGQSYELQYAPFCNNSITPNPGPYKFAAAAEAPLPTKIGTLQGTPSFTTKDFGTTQVTITATYLIDPEMKPWAAVYELFTVLDGKQLGTKATLSGTDSVQVNATGWCDASSAATQQHSLQLRAKLPFATTLETASAPLTFSCPAPNINTPLGTNPPVTPGGPTTVPTATSGGGSSSGNGNPKPSGTTSSGGSSSGSTFSCASAPVPSARSETTSAAALAGVAIVLGALSRRRRRTAATRRS